MKHTHKYIYGAQSLEYNKKITK